MGKHDRGSAGAVARPWCAAGSRSKSGVASSSAAMATAPAAASVLAGALPSAATATYWIAAKAPIMPRIRPAWKTPNSVERS